MNKQPFPVANWESLTLSRPAIWLVVGALLIATAMQPRTHAITLNIEYTTDFGGDESPSWDANGAILIAHFQTAKQIWEAILPGGGEYSFDFQWDDDIDGLGLTTLSPIDDYIEIDPNRLWFADPTPGDSVEFSFADTVDTMGNPLYSQRFYSQLSSGDQSTYFPGTAPPGTLEVMYRGFGSSSFNSASGQTTVDSMGNSVPVTARNGFDLLSVVLHEIGHVLGINNYVAPFPDYDIKPEHIGGVDGVSVLEGDGGHLAGDATVPGFLMCDACEVVGRRRLPTATEVLVIAEDQDITDVRLPRVERISTGTWSNTNGWIGGAVPNTSQDVFIRHGGSVTLDVDALAKNVKVFSGNNLAVQNRSFYLLATEANSVLTNGILDFRGATVSVGSGGTIAANLLLGHPSGLTASAGSLVRFNDFATGSTPATAASFNGSVAIGFDNDFTALTSPLSIVFVPSWANWNIGENLIIGDQNFATVIMDNGTWTVNGNATLGKVLTFLNGGWTGGVTLQNDGAMTIGGNLDIPLGAVTVEDSATLNVAGDISIGKQSSITFRDSRAAPSRPYSLAGGKTEFVDGNPIFIAGGSLTFEDNAYAADASITVDGGAGAGAAGGTVTFKGDSLAGDVSPTAAQFHARGGVNGAQNVAGMGGTVRFEGTSGASNANLNNYGAEYYLGAGNGTGGRTIFAQNASAEQSTIHNHGTIYVNSDGGATLFYNYSTAGSATITNHADGSTSNFVGQINARTTFYDFSDAGNATIENEGAPYSPVPTPPGLTEFRGNSSAGLSNIHNRAVLTTSGLGAGLAGRTMFYDSATAADATIHTYEGASDHGRVEFRNQSKAGRARIIMENVPTATSNGGYVNFYDNSTAEQSQIFVRAGVCCFGGISFNNNATAADAQILTEDGASTFNISFLGNSTAGDPASAPTAAKALFTLGRGIVMSFYDTTKAEDAGISLAHGSSLFFQNNSSAGQAQIAASGSSVYPINGGAITFNTGSLVNNSTITLGGGTASLATGASVLFNNGSHAGNSTITANGGSNGGGGATITFSNSYGDTAQVIANAGSTVDFVIQPTFNNGTTTLGSIEGAGKFLLRGSHLITGSRNTNTTVSGTIVDSPPGSATGGRLTKVGTGTLSLAGTNTYSGLTTVNDGTLSVTGSISGGAVVNSGASLGGTGSVGGLVTVASGAYLAPGASIGTITLAGGLTTNAGSILDFELGPPTTGDKINVTLAGGLTLNGGIVNLFNAGGLGAGMYTLIDYAGTLGGAFGNLALGTQPAGFSFSLVNNAASTSIDLMVSPAGVPGDFNNDGKVDAADFVIWRKNDGTPAGFNAWRANFGNPPGAGSGSDATGSASAAIPEPATGRLLVLGFAGILLAARRRTAPCCAFAVAAALAAPAAADVVVQDNIAFNAKKLNPYGEGPAWEEQEVFSLIPNEPLGFNGKIKADLPLINVDPVAVALEAVLGVSLPSLVKGQIGATIAGSTNLSFGYYVTAGQLDISYPAASNINFQTVSGGNHVLGNQQYTIGSDFLPGVSQRLVTSQFLQTSGGAGYLSAPLGGVSFTDYSSPSFATTSPWAQAWLDASADLHGGIHTKVTALGGVKEWRKDFNFDTKVGGRLVEVDPSGLWVAGEQVLEFNVDQPYGPIQVPGPGGPAELTIQLPKLNVASDPINGEVLHARRVKPVATLTGSLEKLIPFVGGFLHNSFGPLEYDLLQLSGGPQIGLYQDLTFTPDPKVRLAFSEPVQVAGSQCGSMVCAGAGPLRVTQVAEFDLGQDDIVWKPMFSNDNSITIKPTYVMNANFRNETGIDVSLLVDVDALSFKAPFFSFEEDQTIGPYFTKEFAFDLFDVELFTQSFPVPIGNVTAGPITIPKLNLGVEVGLGDLTLFTSNFIGFDPQGHDIYEMTFHRTVVGENEPRVYQATVTGTYTNFTPEGGGEEDEAFYMESLQDVMLTDSVTSVQYNLGRNICMSGCDLSSWLPASSPGYPDPNQSLGTLYITELPTDPNIDVDVPNHPMLGQYNGPPNTNTGTPSEGPVEFADRRDYPDTTILVRQGEIIPDGIGRFDSFGGRGINENGGVAYYSNLTVVPPGSGTTGYYFTDDTGKAKLVRSGEPVPGGDGDISSLPGGGSLTAVNNAGQFAFSANITNSSSTQGVFRAGPDELKLIARLGQTAPDGSGGTFAFGFTPPALNDVGQLAFWSYVSTSPSIWHDSLFVGDGDTLTKYASAGDAIVGRAATLDWAGSFYSINNSGLVAFDAATSTGGYGVFVSNGTSIKAIAIDGDPAPLGGQFSGFFDIHDLNDAGQVAVFSGFRQTPGGAVMYGLFRGDGTTMVQIAREGQLAPDQDGTLMWQSFNNFQLNDAGQVVFRGQIDASVDYSAILLGDGGNLTQIARVGTSLPDGNGLITKLNGIPQLNNHGHVAFVADFVDDEEAGIVLFDGTNLIRVVRLGQPLAGGTITSASLIGINDDMQVAYTAALSGGRTVIARFEPSLYWSKTVSGNWSTADDWSLGIEPINPYDVFIIAENDLTVAGPAANRTVKSLTLGAEDSANARLHLASNVTLTATNGTTIRPNGVLTGHGTLAGTVTNEGTISPGASPGALSIDGDFTQSSAGRLVIEMASAISYDQLLVTGDLTLGGTLTVALLDGFVPTQGQSFSIFGDQLDSITGAFQSFEIPTFNGLTFAVSQSLNAINLQVVESNGDFNHDGSVNAADYVAWRKGINVAPTPDNYNLWRAHFGATPGSGGGSARLPAVPEPASPVLLVFAAASLPLIHRRRRDRLVCSHPATDAASSPRGRHRCYDVAHVRCDAAARSHRTR